MDKSEFFEYCERVLEANGLSDFAKKPMLEGYFALTREMQAVNKVMNLTAITEDADVIVKHIADSLVLMKHIGNAKTIADIGCGAGFPSLPCAIAAMHLRPEVRFFGFDSTKKRVDYVNATAEKLGLSNIKAYCGRAEDFGKRADFRERFDILSARAVSELYILAELSMPLLKVGGRMVSLKGQKAHEELANASSHIPNLGGNAPVLTEYELFDGNGIGEYRAVIVTDKFRKTPNLFPRAYTKIVQSAKKVKA